VPLPDIPIGSPKQREGGGGEVKIIIWGGNYLLFENNVGWKKSFCPFVGLPSKSGGGG